MSGSHHAPPPGQPRPDEATRYDLRTATQHEADDVAQLALRLDNLQDIVEAQAATIASQGRTIEAQRAQLAAITSATMTDFSTESHRTTVLEGRTTALEVHSKAHAQAIGRIADAVQVLILQQGPGQ